jgi:hypothetical protein
MSTTAPHHSEVAGQQAISTNDTSFDSFIDSNLILDASSPAPSTPKKAHRETTTTRKELAPLSALPTRLANSGGMTSPVVTDFLNYPHTNASSDVTTPTTSSSSTLHNLNFDFFDGSDHTGSADNSTSFASEGPISSNLTPVTTFGDSPMQAMSPNSRPASNHVFSWNAAPSAFYPIPMAHSFSRSVDDMGVHHSAAAAANPATHHHQRSLSLRDVAPPSASDDMVLADSLTTLPFPSVKLEQDNGPHFAGAFTDNAPSPITEDHSSPSSSAISTSQFDQSSPRQEKKRRLDSPSESMTSNHSSKGSKGASMARSSTGITKKGGAAANSKRSRASTLTDKNSTTMSPPSVVGLGFNPASLIENVAASNQAKLPEANVNALSIAAMQGVSQMEDTSMEGEGSINGSSRSERGGSAAPRPNNKRPPPSASQVTESGQPFPVIDTSAKHSSLFVPPDTSGLTKREARLVKNRAAAFLSRQRKREQFEELEIKCKSLCRLVWRFWEIVAGPNHEIKFAEKYSNTRILPIVLGEEADEVREVLEMVVALKGGSVAPTEDGQLQGAMAAGITSANGKITGTIANGSASVSSAAASQNASPAAQNANAEIARLQAELQESKKRESTLQAELAQERSMRINDSYTQQVKKPFKGNKHEEALSLTISPEYRARDVGEDEDDLVRSEETSRRRVATRASTRSGSSRTSERLQRQQSQLSLTTVNGAATGGQRKAAGAALMMVLFSFALFGLPNGQIPRAGGITRVGNAEDFSVGKVIGAPISGAQYTQEEEDEEMVDYDLTGKQAPSSHLSVKDLLPPMPDITDLLNLEDARNDEEEEMTNRPERMNRSFRDVLSGSSHGDGEDNVVDYQAFAKDLGASLDWDVQRGFIVIGSDHDRIETEEAKESNDGSQTDSNSDKAKSKDDTDAPTKLTLFVPAPDVIGDGMEAEDHFYDAPLASADVTLSPGKDDGLLRDLTQAEATKAALRVLRNHRIAQEAAALATSRRLGKKPAPSQRVGSPRPRSSSGSQSNRSADAKRKIIEGEEEEDFSNEVMDATMTTNKIRGTDFYQLEFSLSGAKVRNVAELAKLLGVVRNKKD